MELRVVRPTNSSRAIGGGRCEAELFFQGHLWRTDPKITRCERQARFLRVYEGVVVERLCGRHANSAIRWKLVGDIQPIVREVP